MEGSEKWYTKMIFSTWCSLCFTVFHVDWVPVTMGTDTRVSGVVTHSCHFFHDPLAHVGHSGGRWNAASHHCWGCRWPLRDPRWLCHGCCVPGRVAEAPWQPRSRLVFEPQAALESTGEGAASAESHVESLSSTRCDWTIYVRRDYWPLRT